MHDRATEWLFLVDTGSDVSVLPKRKVKKVATKARYNVAAVNNTPIRTYGTHERVLDLELAKQYPWNFIVADVSVPILGADFLETFDLLPDLKRKRLVDGERLVSVSCTSGASDQPSVHCLVDTTHTSQKIATLLQKYSVLLKPPQYKENPPHNVEHHI